MSTVNKRIVLIPTPRPRLLAQLKAKDKISTPVDTHKVLKSKRPSSSVFLKRPKTPTTLASFQKPEGFILIRPPPTMKPYKITESGRSGGRGFKARAVTRTAAVPKFLIVPTPLRKTCITDEAGFQLALNKAKEEKEAAKRDPSKQASLEGSGSCSSSPMVLE